MDETTGDRSLDFARDDRLGEVDGEEVLAARRTWPVGCLSPLAKICGMMAG
jgi:hypothetical protein